MILKHSLLTFLLLTWATVDAADTADTATPRHQMEKDTMSKKENPQTVGSRPKKRRYRKKKSFISKNLAQQAQAARYAETIAEEQRVKPTEDKPVTGTQEKTFAQRIASLAGHVVDDLVAKDREENLAKQRTALFAQTNGREFVLKTTADVSINKKSNKKSVTTPKLTALAGKVAKASTSLQKKTDADNDNVAFSLFDTDFETLGAAQANPAPAPAPVNPAQAPEPVNPAEPAAANPAPVNPAPVNPAAPEPANPAAPADTIRTKAQKKLKASIDVPLGVTLKVNLADVTEGSTYKGLALSETSDDGTIIKNYDATITINARKRAAFFAATAVGLTYLGLLAYGYKVHNNFMPGQEFFNRNFEFLVKNTANFSPNMAILNNLLRTPLTTATKALPQQTFEITTNTLTGFGKILPTGLVNLFVNKTTQTVVLG